MFLKKIARVPGECFQVAVGAARCGQESHIGIEDLKVQIRSNIYDQTEVKHKVEDGFVEFTGFSKTVLAEGGILELRDELPADEDIKRFLFRGITKSMFDAMAFHVRPEREFAIVLEDDKKVLKWLRPPHDRRALKSLRRRPMSAGATSFATPRSSPPPPR